MGTLRQLAVMVREVQKHKLELQQKVVDEVDALVEIILMPTDPLVTTWSEEKLVLGRQRARSTGQLIRQFGHTIVGIELLSRMDNAFAANKRNEAVEDVLLRLRSELCNDSCVAWKASGTEADMVKFKGRVMKVKKEMASARQSMDEASVNEHEATFTAIETAIADAVSHLHRFVNKLFDDGLGNAIVETLEWKGGKQKDLSSETRAKLVKRDTAMKEALSEFVKTYEGWDLEALASEGSPLAGKALMLHKVTQVLMYTVPLLAGDTLADEAPTVEELPDFHSVLNKHTKAKDLVSAFFVRGLYWQ